MNFFDWRGVGVIVGEFGWLFGYGGVFGLLFDLYWYLKVG